MAKEPKKDLITRIRELLEREYLSFRVLSSNRRWPLSLRMRARSGAQNAGDVLLPTVLNLISQVVNADRTHDPREVWVLDRFLSDQLGLSKFEKLNALRLYRTQVEHPMPFQTALEAFGRLTGGDYGMAEHLVDLLYAVALADENYSAAEETLVETAVQFFSIEAEAFDRIKKRHELRQRWWKRLEELDPEDTGQLRGAYSQAFNARNFQSTSSDSHGPRRGSHRQASSSSHTGQTNRGSSQAQRPSPLRESPLTAAYSILGCKPTDSLQQVKRSYRKLVLQFHPDRLIHRGLGSDFKKFAEERFREIQSAYDEIIANRE